MSLLKAENITVHDGAATLLSPLSLRLNPGEPLVILGEIGSGKSLMAQAIMGTLPPALVANGQIIMGKRVLDAASPEQFQRLWGRELGVLPQEPWLSLDPLMRARDQIAEAHRLVRGLGRSAAGTRAQADLVALGLADSADRYPHELSGGMAQRVAIAAARAGGARITIADEPTKGLDAARRDDVARLMLSEMGETGGLLIITHDLALAQMVGGHLIVLRSGEIVEQGVTDQVFASPQQPYTRQLLNADPEKWTPRKRAASGATVVRTKDLAVARAGRTLFDKITLEIGAGEVLGVTGPSGCGKSSLGDALLGLIKPAKGTITRHAEKHPFAFQKLYQDPVAAFPRKQTLGKTIFDTLALSGGRPDQVERLLDRLGLDPRLLARRPDAVSGGELQRLSLLRVLLRNPSFIVADEPTSRLDPITQAKIISLLTEIAEKDGVAVILVSHDTALVRSTCAKVLNLGTHCVGAVSESDIKVEAMV
tara:strand:- start:1558 stop:3000 length:1443 start_codon:yes stop_codon:yes gene_type:complete